MTELAEDQVRAAAAAIANARVMRRGAPAISNVLDILPSRLREEVMEDARAALDAAAALGEEARRRGRQYLELVRHHAGYVVTEDACELPDGQDPCTVGDLIDSALIALVPWSAS